jgi:hypothetical protein
MFGHVSLTAIIPLVHFIPRLLEAAIAVSERLATFRDLSLKDYLR